jgi:hypothetical protein
MTTYRNLYIRNRAIAVEGETVLVNNTYKTCKLNTICLNGEKFPATWDSGCGWTYYDYQTHERHSVPDSTEIDSEWE